jgi:hypothetical protein
VALRAPVLQLLRLHRPNRRAPPASGADPSSETIRPSSRVGTSPGSEKDPPNSREPTRYSELQIGSRPLFLPRACQAQDPSQRRARTCAQSEFQQSPDRTPSRASAPFHPTQTHPGALSPMQPDTEADTASNTPPHLRTSVPLSERHSPGYRAGGVDSDDNRCHTDEIV